MERFIRIARPVLAAFALVLLFAGRPAIACEGELAACGEVRADAFQIITNSRAVSVVLGDAAPDAVRHAADNLLADMQRVSGGQAPEFSDTDTTDAILIGVYGDGSLADQVVRYGLPGADQLDGQWEGFVQAVVRNPLPGIESALVILGSDPRGAVYGIYDLSERIGVSPWYWWADVPVQQRDNLWITAGTRYDAPAVRYRGFFINDEDPAFGGWAREQFGGVNAQAYEHVFELLLRLKGNYLWPAMWGKSLAEDDPASLALAAQMGIVLGTSHHEPLTRAHTEWDRALEAGTASGEWNYGTNPEGLQQFWREGMERHVASGADAVVTIGMRGDGDEAMSEDTAIPLLEQVVAAQRDIIAQTTGAPAEETPQVWALYKEVQDYYDQGMEVPDDVILLFADDNWGQIRRLPDPHAEPRAGGYGVYYHFDYVGGPRSYKWIDTIQQGKTWQQMNLAWERGARDLWVVNVGDIKPAEYQLDFFLDMAWDPEAMTVDALGDHSRQWAAQQFGPEHAEEIAAMMDEYARLASRRKPELLDAEVMATREMGEIAHQFDGLRQRLVRFIQRADLPREMRPAFFQLVEHRILAMANLYGLQRNAAANQRLAAEGDYAANRHGDRTLLAIVRDQEYTERYHSMLDGKWNHMMSQPHIGYTSWDDPDENIYPEPTFLPANERAPADGPQQILLTHAYPRVSLSGGQTSARGEGAGLAYTAIPALGRRGSALVALPQGRGPTTVEDGVFAEYRLETQIEADHVLSIHLSPTLDTIGDEGMRFGVQWNDGPVEEMQFYLEATNGQYGNPAQVAWNEAVIGNIVTFRREMPQLQPGDHRLRIYRIDDNVVIDSIDLRFALAGG